MRTNPKTAIDGVALRATVHTIVGEVPFVDIHTHVFDPALGPVLLWGIDELLTYHYLVAEFFRASPATSTDAFWAMPKSEQADRIWQTLFVERSPVSEACRGVLTVLHTLGLDTNAATLDDARTFFREIPLADYVNRVFREANLESVIMTNDPLDPQEGPRWLDGFARDPRFLGVLRLDSAIMSWPDPVPRLQALGYRVDDSLSGPTLAELRRYLDEWVQRLDARYLAISLPPSFSYPAPLDPTTDILVKTAIPVARDHNIPLALMIGVRKLVNPALRLAGDSVGKADTAAVERLALDHPDVRFLVTMLGRENMHELCIAARKFANILPFGCWWFLNNPSLIDEITRMRFETLGLSFIPQHSDARVLDQLIYKWKHSRALIADVLTDKYADLLACGRTLTDDHIRRDVRLLLGGIPAAPAPIARPIG